MFKKSSSKEDGSWLSLSDLMTVLMVLFLIIAVIIAAESSRRLKDVQGVIQTFIDQENNLCKNFFLLVVINKKSIISTLK